VYVAHVRDEIHPITYELIGKAVELAAKIKQPTYAVLVGNKVEQMTEELLHYGLDAVVTYDDPAFEDFSDESYTNALVDFVKKYRPCAILTGATTIGRQLAPRVAAALHTGLTADCTILDMDENTDLQQVRPAFGGNIMAHIITPNNRPQMATVRYRVMDAAKRHDETTGKVYAEHLGPEQLATREHVLSVVERTVEQGIDAADIIVSVGRGVKKRDDLAQFNHLAELLGGQLACTRPLVEAGWFDASHQIGLSGRTVRPKLIINCGISGSIQYVSGMNHADCIISVNSDPDAPIFDVSHYAVVGDIDDVVPRLIEALETPKGA
jgi:electron transfer flavoprotein alpha subunit